MTSGHYMLFPCGCCWEYAEIVDGEMVRGTCEANMGSHIAARDRYAWLGDLDEDSLEEMSGKELGDVLEACGYDRDAEVGVGKVMGGRGLPAVRTKERCLA